jgi:hypothetical protein
MLIAVLAIALLVGAVSAGILTYYGRIESDVTVLQSVLLDDKSYTPPIEEDFDAVGGDVICKYHWLRNTANVPVPVQLVSGGYPTDAVTVKYFEAPSITIDGVITEAEWGKFFWFSDSNGFDAWDAYGTPTHTTTEGRTFKAYAVADCENLYLAFDVIDDKDNLAGDSLNINFNVGGLTKIDAGDCSLETNWIDVPGKDVMWGVCTGDGWGTRVRTTLPPGVKITWGFIDHRMYEVVIPLSVLGVKLGDQVGIAGNIYEGYGSTGSPGLLWNDFKDGLCFTNWEDLSYYRNFAIGTEITSPFTLEPYEVLPFYICYEFAIDIKPETFTIYTEVQPA